jgi:hypothetical protein
VTTAASGPRPRAVQAALRKTTEFLAGEFACPTAAPPDWSEFEWRVARAAAAMHGVSALLSVTLRWRGPPGWREFLDSQHQHTLRRHRRIEALLHSLDERARAQGVALVALKGAALHALGVYRPGERPMADLDVLVEPRDLECIARLLGSLGFRPAYSTWKHQVFVPAEPVTHASLGEHCDDGLKVEVHTRLSERLPVREWEMSEAVLAAQARPGLNAYATCAALMSHLLLHAAGTMVFQGLRLLHLNDLARLARRMSEADWRQLVCGDPGSPAKWWALPPLALTARYFPGTVPAQVLAAMRRECPLLLRRSRAISDVSLSYLWISAFPALRWAHPPREALRYAVSRIRPDREVLQMRRLLAETQVAMGESSWDRLSQSRRMLRWVVARQTRADTMFAVRTALAQPA